MSDEGKKRAAQPPKPAGGQNPQNPWQQDSHEGIRQAMKAFSMLGGVGVYFVVFVGICVFLGYEADEAFGLGHTGRLLGIVLGFPAAMYSLYRQLKKGGLV
ncbi:MAG: AtpZ/AtpI family protein [Selenomonadaceae bacterium]|nr:AtpZ/AtpI family protein [Selenomonadaceae bacterium]